MRFASYLCALLVILNGAVEESAAEHATRTVSQGTLKGLIQQSRNGRNFESYLGIPYVAPPVGDLRFKAPQPPTKWQGVLDATKYGSVCPQHAMLDIDVSSWLENVTTDENCLYLNVFVPQIPQDEDRLLPVMVYIHGGGFELGSAGPLFHGPGYIMDKDVILVSFNYRLGIVGFLSTEDEVAPGNWGLKDQVAALQWVKENIAKFGGDPNSVTIFGMSAGGASVHFLVLSPLAKGLFHKAIAQSGTALCYWAVQKNAREKAFKLGQILNCPKSSQDSSSELLKCLRHVDINDLVRALAKFKEWNDDPLFPFVPSIEPESVGKEAFLSDDPFTLLEKGEYNQVPFITGVTSDEGLLRTAAIFVNEELMTEIDTKFNQLLPLMFGFEEVKNAAEVSDRIRKFYFKGESLSKSTIQQFTDLTSDRMFFQGAIQTVSRMASTSRSPVYFYKFDYNGKQTFPKILTGKDIDLGVCHGDDLFYLFDAKFFPVSEEDNRMTDIFLDLWTNFASAGNPTPPTSNVLHNLWSPVIPGDVKLLRLNLSPSMEKGFYEDRIQFWNSLLPRTRKAKNFSKTEL